MATEPDNSAFSTLNIFFSNILMMLTEREDQIERKIVTQNNGNPPSHLYPHCASFLENFSRSFNI